MWPPVWPQPVIGVAVGTRRWRVVDERDCTATSWAPVDGNLLYAARCGTSGAHPVLRAVWTAAWGALPDGLAAPAEDRPARFDVDFHCRAGLGGHGHVHPQPVTVCGAMWVAETEGHYHEVDVTAGGWRDHVRID